MLARVVNYRARGIGDIFNPSTDPNLACGFFAGGVFKPECWAQVASQIQYGTIPQVVAPPPPHAPATLLQDTLPGAFTPDQALLRPGEAGEPTRQAIVAAESSGAYVPAGNFPGLFDPAAWLKENAVFVALVAGGGLLLFSLLPRRGRR